MTERHPDRPDTGDDRGLVLVIEDDRKAATRYQELLATHHEVILEHTLEDGLRAAEDCLPDIILCDVKLPPDAVSPVDNEAGVEFVHRLRTHEHLRTTPVLLISVLGEESSYRRKGLAAGADDYIRKSDCIDEVELRIRNQLVNRTSQPRVTHDDVALPPVRLERLLVISNPDEAQADALRKLSNALNKRDKVFGLRLCNPLFTAHELARETKWASVSRNRLNKRTRELFGYSRARFLTLARANYSKNFLDRGALASEAARLSGFGNAETYSRAFKRAFNETPSQYLRRQSKS